MVRTISPLATPTTTQNPAGLVLSITAVPNQICAYLLESCSAGTGVSQVTLTATAEGVGRPIWPDVQVAFVLETTLYDGVGGPDAWNATTGTCSSAVGGPCLESNGVPFFVAHAEQIAEAIQAANAHSRVSFALVDYFATLDSFDDNDGAEYHVDIPAFVPAFEFGPDVQATFQAEVLGGGYTYLDSDYSDNFLHSSSITALFGTIVGSGLDWLPDTHHVIVWIGSTAPRAPGYPVNYCVSPGDYSGGSDPCDPPACEPPHAYGIESSPNCEGWVGSTDSNPNDSIAGLARSAPQCTNSVGGVCTVDAIDLYNTPTDPWSPAWPKVPNGGPGSPAVLADSRTILQAGCDLATATGGSWDGPSLFSCSGKVGTLRFVSPGPSVTPNVENPPLYDSLRSIGFGPILTPLDVKGSDRPMFRFLPMGAISPFPGYAPAVSCQLASGNDYSGCATQTIYGRSSRLPLSEEWNWSSDPTENVMHLGDRWQVTFLVWASGPPFGRVPVDACVLGGCAAAGSYDVYGAFTSAAYQSILGTGVVTQSFPVAILNVEPPPPSVAPPATLPPAPTAPPTIPGPIGTSVPLPTPLSIGAQVAPGLVTLQGVLTGLLAAAYVRVAVRSRPIAVAVASLAGAREAARFDRAWRSAGGPQRGRFE